MEKVWLRNLEYNVSHICNLKCANCDHLSPYFTRGHVLNEVIDLDRFRLDVTVLSKHLRVGHFLLLGGEPLLNSDLPGYAEAVRGAGLAERIQLWTNGHLLGRASDRLLKSFDEIVVTNYPSRPLTAKQVESTTQRCGVLGVNFRLQTREDFVRPFVADKTPPAVAEKVFLTCYRAWGRQCFVLFNGLLGRCSRMPFLSSELESVGVARRSDFESDFLQIEDVEDFAEKVRAYIRPDRVPEVCHYCTGSAGVRETHRQLDTGEIKAASWADAKINDSLDLTELERLWRRRKTDHSK